MILRPATADDIDALFEDLRPHDKGVLEKFGGLALARDTVDRLMLSFPHQLFVTKDGKVAALWIGLRKWDGLIEIYGYTTNVAEENRVGFFRASNRALGYMKDILGAHKIECVVWNGYDRSIKWLERLGFEREGYMRHHGPDKTDAVMMGRVL